MFVYERNGNICVVFDGNLPEDVPAYSIDINEEAKNISVNGTIVAPRETESASN